LFTLKLDLSYTCQHIEISRFTILEFLEKILKLCLQLDIFLLKFSGFIASSDIVYSKVETFSSDVILSCLVF